MAIAVIVATFKALIVLSIIILILGLIKPKWILFWMKEPSRMLATSIALILFMGSVTGYSQFTVRPKPKTEKEKERTQEEINNLNQGNVPKN